MPLKRQAPSLSFSQAYHAAQSFLVHIRATPSRLEEPADGIVEFEGGGYLGRLRYDDAPLTQGAILGLLRQVEDEDIRTILFSASGFTGAAEVFAENLNVALFSITAFGDMSACSPAAHLLMPQERFEPPFAPEEDEEVQDRPPGVWIPGQDGIADHEWVDCGVCGTTHHPEANFCHKCGTHLTRIQRAVPAAHRRTMGESTTPPVEVRRQIPTQPGPRAGDAGTAMRCRSCGSRDIEIPEN